MTDTVWYVVNGFGCFDSNGPEQQNFISKNANISYDNIKYRCPKTSSAFKCIVKTYLGQIPLKNSKFVINLTEEIFSDLLLKTGDDFIYKNVVVFGHSYGGAIVNSIAEAFNKMIGGSDENLDEIFKRLSMATFGSIYIPNDSSIDKINILNYISISDVAIKCNQIVPIRFIDMHIFCVMGKIICKLPEEDKTTKTKQLCLYKDDFPLCVNRRQELSGPKSKNASIFDWREHNYYYLILAILRNFAFNLKRNKNFINIYECLTFSSEYKHFLPKLVYYTDSDDSEE